MRISVGEAVDRASILWIKSQKSKEPESKGVLRERFDDLERKLLKVYPSIELYQVDLDIMRSVNLSLWDQEDIVRAPEVSQENFEKASRRIPQLNDYRNRAKNNITRGFSDKIEYKVYSEEQK